MKIEKLAKIIEALLFATEKPLSLNRLQQVIPAAENHQIDKALDKLKEHYQEHAFQIVEVAGGYQLMTKSDYYEWIKGLAARSRPRLSQAALETLSIIAYKQPISRVEIEAIRGVNSDGVLGTLLERNIIVILGRADTVGRPLLYGTTNEFLQYFGLKDLSDLPKPEEIEAMLQSSEYEQHQAEKKDDSDSAKRDET